MAVFFQMAKDVVADCRPRADSAAAESLTCVAYDPRTDTFKAKRLQMIA